LGTVK